MTNKVPKITTEKKSEKMILYGIKTYTNKGDTLYDFSVICKNSPTLTIKDGKTLVAVITII